MKRLLLTATLVLASFSEAWAEGTIMFYNNVLTRVQMPDGSGGIRNATAFNVAVYYATMPGEWQGPGLPLGRSDDSNPGLFGTPGVPDINHYPIPGTEPGQKVFMQFFVWSSSYGDDPYLAWANGSPTGATEVKEITLGGRDELDTILIWRSSASTDPNRFPALQFSLGPSGPPPVVPEPSTIALGVIGAAVLFLRTRRFIK